MDKTLQAAQDYLAQTRLLLALQRLLGDKISRFVLDYLFYIFKAGWFSMPGSGYCWSSSDA